MSAFPVFSMHGRSSVTASIEQQYLNASVWVAELADAPDLKTPFSAFSTTSFKTEVEERRFWEEHDSTQYVDWSGAEPVRFPNLKPSTQSISLRLPASLLDNIKIEANRRDVPYQSLIKVWLAEKTAALSTMPARSKSRK